MRETRPAHFSGTNGSKVECACGCGALFVPTRNWQRFYTTACRKRGWKLGRISTRDHAAILARLERLEKDLGTIKQALKDNAIEERS